MTSVHPRPLECHRVVAQQARDAHVRDGPARPVDAAAGAGAPRGARHAADPAVAGRDAGDLRRHGLFLGCRALLLEPARRLDDRRRIHRRVHAAPDVRRDVHRPHRSHRGGPRRLRPGQGRARRAAQDVLGEPRPDAGQRPGQRPRHAVPHRRLPDHGGAARRRRGLAGPLPGSVDRPRLRRDHHRGAQLRRRRPLVLRRGLPPAVPAQEPRRLLQPRLLPGGVRPAGLDRRHHQADLRTTERAGQPSR